MKYIFISASKAFQQLEDDATLPDGAIELEEADYQAFMDGMLTNKFIHTDTDGKPTFDDPMTFTLTWDQLRITRDTMLTNSDWTQMPDADLDDDTKALWKAYRQKLRDLPAKYKVATKVVWPAVPTASS